MVSQKGGMDVSSPQGGAGVLFCKVKIFIWLPRAELMRVGPRAVAKCWSAATGKAKTN